MQQTAVGVESWNLGTFYLADSDVVDTADAADIAAVATASIAKEQSAERVVFGRNQRTVALGLPYRGSFGKSIE
jgi:hypothetical protein